MIRDGKDITGSHKAQVCVIGSGPAGITAAWELSAAGLDVILLDGSRKLDYSVRDYYKKSFEDKAKLYAGVAEGIFSPYAYIPLSTFLIRSTDPDAPSPDFPEERERVYGGTPTHGGGQCRPLDPLAFEKRHGFPGWPITRRQLDPYYAKAATLNHLYGDYGADGVNFTAEFWAGKIKDTAVPNLEGFVAEMYQCMRMEWVNFATRTFNGNAKVDDRVRVIVNATLLDIVAQGGSVRYLVVASMNDDTDNPQKATEFTITADVYILACGAIENARQLLLSGIGNNLVGRYFMCHPLTRNTPIKTRNGKKYLCPPEYALMQENPWNDSIRSVQGRFAIADEIAKEKQIGKCWFWVTDDKAQMYLEMTPNYCSYVSLADTRDPVFGQRQTYIRWQLTELDKRTYETNCTHFDAAARKREKDSGIEWSSWKELANEWTINGHHLGTTRMSASTAPEGGVVDENLKVHGIDNLYVAGASVFPTCGTSNPTMTIVALSIRLAEHLLPVIRP